jgi:hypothetical protein
MNYEIQDLKKQFKKAVDGQSRWEKEASYDFDFYLGKQWEAADVQKLREANRPAVTINMCRPIINMLVGYFTQNPYEPLFLPAGGEKDIAGCKIVESVNKNVYEQTEFKVKKNDAFQDKCICGKGWKFYGIDWDYEKIDPRIVVERVSPFSVYVDPECKNEDLSDAEYLCRAKWVTRDKLKTVYPEKADEIDNQVTRYAEEENNIQSDVLTWYQADGLKLRVVEHWYKEHYLRTLYKVPQGLQQTLGLPATIQDASPMAKKILDKVGKGLGVEQVKLPAYRMKLCVYAGDVELERMDSPYKHNLFPYVQDVAYYTGEGDEAAAEPHGVIRDLRDVQRELNKAESQMLDILNKQPNTGWWVPESALDDANFKALKEKGASAGFTGKYRGPAPPTQITPPPFNAAIAQMAESCKVAFRSISGINEELLGTDVPSSASGKAIMLRKQSAQTQIAVLFEQSRLAEKRGLRLLWGTKENPGLIPQYFTDAKVVRIIDDNGAQQFINIAPTGQGHVANPDGTFSFDLSQFEYDIVISETPATATVRMQRLYELVDAAKFVQFPPAVWMDALDLPNKDKYMQMMQQGPPPPQMSATVNVDLNSLPPEMQQVLFQALMQGGKINANIAERTPEQMAQIPQGEQQYSRADVAAM